MELRSCSNAKTRCTVCCRMVNTIKLQGYVGCKAHEAGGLNMVEVLFVCFEDCPVRQCVNYNGFADNVS